MNTLPYNRESLEGRRLYRLLKVKYNDTKLDNQFNNGEFEQEDIPSVLQCRADKMNLIIPGNSSGIKRPLVQVESYVEKAYGSFKDDVDSLDFTEVDDLPLHYIQPLSDAAIGKLVEAGMYSDERFEEVMSKLVENEQFDVETDIHLTHLNAEDDNGNIVPIMFVNPISITEDESDMETEHTTLNQLMSRSAEMAIQLSKDGNVSQLSDIMDFDQDIELFIEDDFDNVLEESSEKDESKDPFVERSAYLDQEVDVSEQLAGTVGYDDTTEDDKIRDLKGESKERSKQAIVEQQEQYKEAYDSEEEKQQEREDEVLVSEPESDNNNDDDVVDKERAKSVPKEKEADDDGPDL